MILGMSLSTFTLVHVLISLAGIASGFVVLFGLLAAQRLDRWTAIFLVTTVLTSVTGFLFPIEKITPGLVLGVISLFVLAITIAARYAFHLIGAWRWIYVVSATMALYLNVFVLVAQSFQKVLSLKVLAPTQTESPFKIAQLIVLTIFIALGAVAVKKFRPRALAAEA